MPRRSNRVWPGREPGYSLDIRGRVCHRYLRVSLNPDDREQKSVDQQDADYQNWQPRAGVLPGRTYSDDDRSASPFATKEREGFDEMRADINAERISGGELIWFWSTSRQTRGSVSLDELADEAEKHHIVWVMGGQVLNPANGKDRQTAGLYYLMDRGFAYDLSAAVQRGKEAAAEQGKPGAVPLYGYRRVYEKDSRGNMLLVKGRPVVERDEFNEADKKGNPVPGTPFAIAREIFDRLEALEPPYVIAASLEDRRIPAPRRPRKCTTCGEKMHKDRGPNQVKGYYCSRGHEQDLCRWGHSAIKFIARNEGYRARRIYQAESSSPADRRMAVLEDVEAKWPPLVTERQFQAVQQALDQMTVVRHWRGTGHAGLPPARNLAIPAARCGECGASMGPTTHDGKPFYKCNGRGCTHMRADWLDAWAEDRLISWLVLLEVQMAFQASREDVEADEDLATIDRENTALKELKQLVREGRAGSYELAVAREEGISKRIKAAEARLAARGPRPTGASITSAEVADKWHALRTGDPDAARMLLAAVATIYVSRATTRGGGITQRFDENRLRWTWNIGTDTSAPGPGRAGVTEALEERRRDLEHKRELARKLLLADPALPDNLIGQRAGCAYGTVRRLREKMTATGEITEPGYRKGADGKRYTSSGNGKPGSPRVTASEGTAVRPAHVVAKRERIAAALAEHPGWSHHRIGTALGVAHDTVKSVCQETGGECQHDGSERDYAWKPRPSNVAKREMISKELGKHPLWSHNKIAVSLGVADDTVRSVCRESGQMCAHGRGPRIGTMGRPALAEKRERIAAALAEHPDWSHNRIAKAVGASAPTVRKVCRESGQECRHRAAGQGGAWPARRVLAGQPAMGDHIIFPVVTDRAAVQPEHGNQVPLGLILRPARPAWHDQAWVTLITCRRRARSYRGTATDHTHHGHGLVIMRSAARMRSSSRARFTPAPGAR